MVKMWKINTNINSFVLLTRLTPDENHAVYIITDNGLLRLEVADLSALPVVTVIKSYDIPALTYADLIAEDDIIYLVGTNFNNSQPQTFILKYPRWIMSTRLLPIAIFIVSVRCAAGVSQIPSGITTGALASVPGISCMNC